MHEGGYGEASSAKLFIWAWVWVCVRVNECFPLSKFTAMSYWHAFFFRANHLNKNTISNMLNACHKNTWRKQRADSAAWKTMEKKYINIYRRRKWKWPFIAITLTHSPALLLFHFANWDVVQPLRHLAPISTLATLHRASSHPGDEWIDTFLTIFIIYERIHQKNNYTRKRNGRMHKLLTDSLYVFGKLFRHLHRNCWNVWACFYTIAAENWEIFKLATLSCGWELSIVVFCCKDGR